MNGNRAKAREASEFPAAPLTMHRHPAHGLELPLAGLPMATLRNLVGYESARALELVAETKPGGFTRLDVPGTLP
jgi:hypothetical protein